MSKKLYKEWTVDVPWGKMAMVSWGDPSKPPVFMMHGYMDTIATFKPLVELLPDTHYYVGLDTPGHGKSDRLPFGLVLTHVHLVEAIRWVVKHMGWDTFVWLGHSAAFLIITFYNAVFPGKISKWVAIDPAASLPQGYLTEYSPESIVWNFHSKYYENYKSFNQPLRPLSYDLAVKLIARSRGLTREQVEQVVTRSLEPAGGGMHRFTFDPRVKTFPAPLLSTETQLHIMTANAPPLLIIAASEPIYEGKTYEHHVRKMMGKIIENIPDCTVVTVEGAHDVHITNPERLVPHIVEFLNRVVRNAVSAKL